MPLGATTEGSTFSYSTTVEAIRVAEYFDPIKYSTTERNGSHRLQPGELDAVELQARPQRRRRGAHPDRHDRHGADQLRAAGPRAPRSASCWCGSRPTPRCGCCAVRCIQGGEVSSAFQKAPSIAAIPCTFNLEIPTGGVQPFKIWGAGLTRV
jgi:hypothetical protein